jgi:uncharacterized protein YndB with AHSA1/START domain
MTQPDTDLSVRASVTVEASRDRAFAVFTDGISSWWPLDTHHIGAETPVAEIIEPGEGGRWFERDGQGNECDHGRVLVWDPPARLVLSWEITADWVHDPGTSSEVEVRFEAVGATTTRVDVEHRKLSVFGARAAEMKGVFSSEGGWPGLVRRFAGAVAAR